MTVKRVEQKTADSKKMNENPKQEVPLKIVGTVRQHESAVQHVTGTAVYVDDIVEPEGTLHIAPGWCHDAVHAEIKSVNLNNVRNAPGVVAVLTSEDIPGKNECSPSFGGDPLLESKLIQFYGQIVFAVVAKTREQARLAAREAVFEIYPKKPVVTIADALRIDSTVLPDYSISRGWLKTKLKLGTRMLTGDLTIGGQEHFYLEGQVALAIPGEKDEVFVHSSTQHPTEVQEVVAGILDIQQKDVTVECRRMGGGFGGKESQANQWAGLAALGAKVTGHACKIRLDRDEDMIMTGKRHEFYATWDLVIDGNGVIKAVDMVLASRCGYSVDLSLGVNDRALFHADSAYFYPSARITSRRLRTNTCSNTAFRGFGGPQGMLAAERMIDSIAIRMAEDPLDIRKRNLYRNGHNTTHYDMEVEEFDTLHDIVNALEDKAEYRKRRTEIQNFNIENHIIKKGLALTPVKFGISFTKSQLNQASALVHLFSDGTIQLNHGGTEMGQGLHTKVIQIVAEVFGVDLDQINIQSTNTSKVPNTSPTAASSSSDLNGMAVKRAAQVIKDRLINFVSDKYKVSSDKIVFAYNQVNLGNTSISLGQLAHEAHEARVHLSSTGFYSTPEVGWDRDKQQGSPFYYFAFGAACSEVSVDTLTGEMVVNRVDIIHDVGNSINSAIDIGQIEGGFVQGMGWLTTEDLVWDEDGQLLTHAPSTYKIPTVTDLPEQFNVEIWASKGNPKETVYRSKAVGEPPLMLANSVFCAIADAVASTKPGQFPMLDVPATPESIMRAINRLRSAGE